MSSVSRGLRTVTGKVAKSRWQQHDPMDAAAAAAGLMATASYFSHAMPSPSRSSCGRYPGWPLYSGAAPAALAAAQFL